MLLFNPKNRYILICFSYNVYICTKNFRYINNKNIFINYFDIYGFDGGIVYKRYIPETFILQILNGILIIIVFF